MQTLGADIRGLMPDFVMYGAHAACFALADGEYAAVAVGDPGSAQALSAMERYLRSAEHAARSCRSEAVAITVIQTEECADCETFLQQLQEIQQLAPRRALLVLDRAWPLRRLKEFDDSEAETGIVRLLFELGHAFKNRLYLNYRKTLEELDDSLRHAIGRGISPELLRNLRKYAEKAFGVRLTEEWGDTWTEALAGCGERLLVQEQGTPDKRDLAELVLRYMEEHYMDNIGIGQIAGELNVTPSYLSHLFHKKTGTPFVKQLTRVRIGKAKELLAGGALSIQQVAEQVGYYSARHFTKLFLELEGVYPSDFKKSAQGRAQPDR